MRVHIIKSISLILSFLFMPLFVYAIDATLKPNTRSMTMEMLIDSASKYNIKLVDWRGIEKTQTYTVDYENLKNQNAWLGFLKKQFEGSFALESDGTKSRMYLLPPGVTASFIQESRKYSQETSIQHMFTQIKNAKKMEETDILTLPEVQILKELALLEHDRTIEYERMVNPHSDPYAYSFKVKYIDSIKMFAPFEKNGLPVKNEMEGFSCFNSYYKYIVKNAAKCQVSRYEDITYFRIDNGTQNIIAVKGAQDNLQISSIVRRGETLVMETHVSGNKENFKSVAKLYSPQGTVTMVDNARIF